MNGGRHRSRRRPEDATKTLRLEDGGPLRDHVAEAVRARFRPVLVVISGDSVGVRAKVEGNMLVGRDPGADLMLPDAGVSWHHAMIEDRGDSHVVVDLGSTNGTTVNGRRLSEAPLQHGDKIVFGKTTVRFEVQDPADQAYDEMVARLINIDDLSGLYTKRRFDSELEQMLQLAASQGQPVGLLVMDLDGVKQINDTHGHSFGAYVIGESGRVIGKVLEGRGIACRFGGDEYVAAVAGLDALAAAEVGEEIRRAIAEHHYEKEGIELRPGISIGVAAFPENAADPYSLFQRGDEALYRAKAAGKGCVQIWGA